MGLRCGMARAINMRRLIAEGLIYYLMDLWYFSQVDELQPHMVLGGLSKKKKAKGKKVCNYL